MQRLKALREQAGMSQEDLTLASGVKSSTIARLELDDSKHGNFRTASALARALAKKLKRRYPDVLAELSEEEIAA